MRRRRATAVATLLALGAALAVVAAAYATPERAAAPAARDAAGASLVKCGKTRSIGLMAPFTGPAASIGINQVHWAQYFQRTYNKTHKTKIKFVNEDTMLGAANGTAEAVKGAQALGSSQSVLGVVGPAGSNVVKATTGALKGAGLRLRSGSATNTPIAPDRSRT